MFSYYNDTDMIVNIHHATLAHGCVVDMSPIQPQELREFKLPVGTYPWVKMWGYKGGSLIILVSPTLLPSVTESESMITITHKEHKRLLSNSEFLDSIIEK